MDIDQVYAAFLRLADLTDAQGERWRPLCEAAAAWMDGRLRPGADPADPRAVLAAAGQARYRYALAAGTGGESSVSVGGVSVSERGGGGVESARALRDELLAGAAELLRCPDAGLWRVDA